uniref:G-protein coupled receptors family 1 profile domain-containing protein n=1 Tax=Amphiprion percula TaxID=161767 RepID=A0A3P8SHS5_AMPPE
MASNSSLSVRRINSQVIFVQVLVSCFLFINIFLITTFFMKEYFYTTMRYILFATTLLSDCLFLLLTNILLICSYFGIFMQMWLCIILYLAFSLCTFVTPLTLTAMTLERYVAICLPLRHAELCSTHKTLHWIYVIHSLGFVPGFVILSIFFALASHSHFTQRRLCIVQAFILQTWQGHLRSAISQFYFLVMCILIIFSYTEIMKVAKAASGENKKSTNKGLRTVILHACQLLLCLIQFWCPFIEAAVLQINILLFINIRYFNYVTFYLSPRCLSPVIYGLRDEMFFRALKHNALCGLHKR